MDRLRVTLLAAGVVNAVVMGTTFHPDGGRFALLSAAVAGEGVSQPAQGGSGVEAPGSSVQALLPQPPAARLREELDTRLKTGLRRSFQNTQRLVTLESLLVRHAGAQERKRSIAAYWRTVKLILILDALSQSLSELENLVCPPDRRAYMESIKGAATSRLAELRADLAAAQADLARWTGITDGNTQVFPDDLPHTGGYRTQLTSLFPDGTAPLELRKIDTLLPLLRQSIYLHYSAMRSAHDAWLAYCEATNSGTPQVEAALAMWQLEAEELVKCLEAIETYNSLILDYVISVAPTSASASQLLEMLLEPASRRVVSSVSAGAQTGSPDAAVRSGAGAAGAEGKTSGANPLDTLSEKWPFHVGLNRSHLFASLVAKENPGIGGAEGASKGFFSQITATRLETFVQQLTHLTIEEANRWLPPDKVDLRDFLANRGNGPGDWAQAAREYWEVIGAQVQLALAIKESSALGEIFAATLPRAGEPGAAEAMLEIHAVRRAADAALQDAHLRFVERRLMLGDRAGLSRGADVVAATLPFSGPYQTRWSYLAPRVDPKDRVHLAGLAEQIPHVYAAIVHAASALLSSDLARQQGLEAYRQGQLQLHNLLEMVRLEFALWREFFVAVRRYNCAIAEYVAGCLPGATLDQYLEAIGYRAQSPSRPAR